jgi:hypothetical protein
MRWDKVVPLDDLLVRGPSLGMECWNMLKQWQSLRAYRVARSIFGARSCQRRYQALRYLTDDANAENQ